MDPYPYPIDSRFRLAGLALLLAGALLACVPDGGARPNSQAPAPLTQSPGGARAASGDSEPGLGSETQRARGLWVLAEGSYRVLDDPSRIAPLLARAARLGATDLFVQVYRGGRAFYPAGPGIERTPQAESFAEAGVDPLGQLIAAAHQRGLAVHAWVNVLSLSTRRDAAMIQSLGREAILVDRKGRSVLDYPDLDLPQPDRRFYRMGTRGIYLDPALPSVRDQLVSTFTDLVTRYPALDGLHLDYIRHPGVLPFSPGSRFGVGLEFGYGAQTRALYRAETGRPDPIDGAKDGTVRGANHWDKWRREQVTHLVSEIAASTRSARPGLVMSAAVISYADRAYLSLAQDWRAWLESGSIDLAIPMVYTLDDRLLGYQLENFAGGPHGDRIWPGLGVWLFDDVPERAIGQLERLRRLGFRGEVLFSDDAIATAPGLLDALVETAP